MGEPAQPTPEDRARTRELAAAIVESVRNDETMPLPLPLCYVHADVQTLVFRLAQEIALLSCDTYVSLQAEVAGLRGERNERLSRAISLLGIAHRKLTYLVRNYPDDKESIALLESISVFVLGDSNGPTP